MSFSLLLDGQRHEIEIVRRRPHLVLRVDGREHTVQRPGEYGDGSHELTIDAQMLTVTRVADGLTQIVRSGGRTYSAALADDGGGGADESLSELRAPMPGAVIEIHAAPGDSVSRGAPLVTIESMKLQTVLGAPRDGIVAEFTVTQDELFGKDQILVRLEAEGQNDA